MTFITVNMDNVEEQKPAPIGKYELQITACVDHKSGEKSKHPGAPMAKVTLGFVDQDINAPVINHFISWPFEGDENAGFKLLQAKRFMSAFGMEWNDQGIDTDIFNMDAVGRTAVLEVGLTPPNPDTGDVFNSIKLPKLRDEPKAVKGTGRRRG